MSANDGTADLSCSFYFYEMTPRFISIKYGVAFSQTCSDLTAAHQTGRPSSATQVALSLIL